MILPVMVSFPSLRVDILFQCNDSPGGGGGVFLDDDLLECVELKLFIVK